MPQGERFPADPRQFTLLRPSDQMCELADLEREHVGRERGPDHVGFAHDFVVLAVRVAAVGELDLDEREAVERRAVEALDVLELGQRVLDGA